MIPCRVYSEEADVDRRLSAFGATRAELVNVVRAVVAERNSSVDADPIGAPGLFAWIHGTRHLRFLFEARGYRRDREKNVETVVHDEHRIKIAYQNVDLAGTLAHDPRATSGKKSASAQMIESGQASLFDLIGAPAPMEDQPIDGLPAAVWYLCVSCNGEDVRAELSLPAAVKNGNFFEFVERIMIVKPNEWASFTITGDNDDAVEAEPLISRRK